MLALGLADYARVRVRVLLAAIEKIILLTLSVRDRQTGSGMAFRSGSLTDTSR